MARCQLNRVMGFEPPSWEATAAGTPPTLREPDHFEPSTVRSGWQHDASAVEERYREDLFTRMPEQVQALVRSQAGAGAGAALTVVPTNRETTIPRHLFRVILLRRLRQALPCLCATADVAVHLTYVAIIVRPCVRAGVLGRRGFALESVAATCREAGGPVRTNLLVRDMDLDVPIVDARRLEVVVDGLRRCREEPTLQ